MEILLKFRYIYEVIIFFGLAKYEKTERGYSVEWTRFFGLGEYNTENTRGVSFKRKMMTSVMNTVNMQNLKWYTDWK